MFSSPVTVPSPGSGRHTPSPLVALCTGLASLPLGHASVNGLFINFAQITQCDGPGSPARPLAVTGVVPWGPNSHGTQTLCQQCPERWQDLGG